MLADTNSDRARRAQLAITAASIFKIPYKIARAEAATVSDLIADLLHYADTLQGGDGEYVARVALANYRGERDGDSFEVVR